MGLFDFFKNAARTAADSFQSAPRDAFNPGGGRGSNTLPPHAEGIGFDDFLPDLGDLFDKGIDAVKGRLNDLAGEDAVNFAWAAVQTAINLGRPADEVEALRQAAAQAQERRDAVTFQNTFCEALERAQVKEIEIFGQIVQPPNKLCRDLGFEVGPPLNSDGTGDLPFQEERQKAASEPGKINPLLLGGLAIGAIVLFKGG